MLCSMHEQVVAKGNITFISHKPFVLTLQFTMYELSILHMSKVMTKLKLLKDDCHRHKIQSYLYLSNMYSKPGHTYYEFQSTIIQVPEEYVCMYGHFRE